ncbi:MAG: hypothetical protein H7836_01940 [Magnetococcus sp. YQC-3]
MAANLSRMPGFVRGGAVTSISSASGKKMHSVHLEFSFLCYHDRHNAIVWQLNPEPVAKPTFG